MNISYSWLKQYIDIDLNPSDLARVLTGIGLEVEGVERVEKIKGGLEGFVADPEVMFVIGLTPNRIDSASHFGVARDLAACLGKDGNITLTRPDISAFKVDHEQNPVDIIVENRKSCPRYAGISISGVTVGQSPRWLQERLLAIGMSPVNNIVDITNFVLHELGQPLHAFDADELRGHRIVVKNLPRGTRFITLDNVERQLSADDLMICDGERPVAIGGVFGGLHSGITDKTRNIFLESAYFDPVSVRLTSKRHGINTDASFRFERGVDPEMTLIALKRCAMLIKEIAGGLISSKIIDVYPEPLKPARVSVTFSNINRLIGKKIDPSLIRSILLSLDFRILAGDRNGYDLLVPQYRVDVTREADVIEEILRIYGYNNIEISGTLQASLSYSSKPDREMIVDMISEYLTGNGFYEIMCNSLTSAAYYDGLTSYAPANLVRILNPLSSELNVMRQTLLFGGLETIQHNTNRQRPDLRLFEFGNCYFFNADKGKKNPLEKYDEHLYLALFITGRKHEPNWISSGEATGIYELKAYLRNVFIRLGIDIDKIGTEPVGGKKDLYADALSFLSGNNVIAEMAIIKESVLKQFDIRNDVYYAVVNWDDLLTIRGDHHIIFNELPRFPEVRRDLALLLDKSLTFSAIKDLAFRTEGKLLRKVDLFDVYEGEQVAEGKKSYAVSFILQDTAATLTDERIDRIMKRLMDAFARELGAVIR